MGLDILCKVSPDIFPRKQDLTFHAKVSIGDTLHEMSNPVFWEK